MRVPRARSGSFPVWALPVSGDVVCLWAVTPASVSDVDIVPDGIAARLRLRRRLLRTARRLSLFVYEAPGFKSGQSCTLTFSADGRAPARARSVAHLADWSAPLVGAAIRLLVEGIATLSAAIPTGSLARFLSLVSSWSVPCAHRGAIGDVGVAVFDFAPAGATLPHALLAATDRAVSIAAARVVRLGRRCCVMVPGELPGVFYFDAGGDLLELAMPAAGDGGGAAWLASLGADDRHAVLDGVSSLGPGRDPQAHAALGEAVDTSLRVAGGAAGDWRAVAVARAPRHFHVVLEGAGDEPEIAASDLHGRPIPVEARWQVRDGDRQVFVCRAVAGEPFAGGPIRLSIGRGPRAAGGWLRPVAAESEAARRHLREVLPWHLAGSDLLDELVVPVAAGARTFAPALPPEIELVPRRAAVGAADPLLVCFHEGAFAGFQRSLIGVALSTAGSTPSLRIVFREPVDAAEVGRISALCAEYGLAAGAVFLAEGDPVNSGCGWRDGDDRFAATVLLRSGSVPRLGGWWQALLEAIAASPGAVWWPGPEGSDLTASSVAARGGLVAAIGRDAPAAGGPAFATFEGLVVGACHAARRDGRLREHEALRFLSPGLGALKVLAEARLDDAVLAFIEAQSEPAAGSARVHRLPRRAGAER